MRKKIAAANWKMYKSVAEAEQFASAFASTYSDNESGPEVRVYVNFLAISPVTDLWADRDVLVGAQNFHPEKEGAFTGEISLAMLASVGCAQVLVGHSERRHVFGETDEFIAAKTKAAVESGFQVAFCVGETLEERKADQIRAVLECQLKSALSDLSQEQLTQIDVAYEPVWAIGTGETATPEIAQEAHAMIREILDEISAGAGQSTSVLYGGSVKPANAADLLAQKDIDGVLVGGASLEVSSWCDIINAFS